MLRHTCILAAALSAALQEGQQQRSIEEEIAALIEKTNALESFHAVYDFDAPGLTEAEPKKGVMEFTYRAPDLARFRITADEVACGDSWVAGEHMYFNIDGKDWKQVRICPPSQARQLLDGLFPPGMKPLEPGVSLMLRVNVDPVSQKPNVELSFVCSRSGRSYVLGWLAAFQRAADEIVVDADTLVLTGEHHAIHLSRATGFMEVLEITTDEGPAEWRLRELQLDQPLDASLVTLPPEAVDAEEDAELAHVFERYFGPEQLRKDAFLRVEHQVDSGKRTWNELARSDWRDFLDALHGEMIPGHYWDWIEGLEEHAVELADWVRDQRAQDDSPEHRAELAKKVAEDREAGEKNMEEALSQYLESLPSVESKDLEPREELFDIEREVVEAVWNELVHDPVLARFDEELGPALER